MLFGHYQCGQLLTLMRDHGESCSNICLSHPDLQEGLTKVLGSQFPEKAVCSRKKILTATVTSQGAISVFFTCCLLVPCRRLCSYYMGTEADFLSVLKYNACWASILGFSYLLTVWIVVCSFLSWGSVQCFLASSTETLKHDFRTNESNGCKHPTSSYTFSLCARR